jgi:hypothetical protein
MSAQKPPKELGLVKWRAASEYKDALATSAKEKKPVFLLFQEIPGYAPPHALVLRCAALL